MERIPTIERASVSSADQSTKTKNSNFEFRPQLYIFRINSLIALSTALGLDEVALNLISVLLISALFAGYEPKYTPEIRKEARTELP